MDAKSKTLAAVVLAAGRATRFGGSKLTAMRDGAPLIAGAVRAALAAPVDSVLCVVGHDAEPVAEAARLSAGFQRGGPALRIVNAERYREGMAWSLRAGLDALAADVEAAFVFLGDMPCVPPQITAALVSALPGRDAVAPVFGNRRGHPVLWRRTMFASLQELSGDSGGRELLDRLGERLALVPTDDQGVLFDVDCAADLENAPHQTYL
jgi:molybdenum cofactor cytidylyltransferase